MSGTALAPVSAVVRAGGAIVPVARVLLVEDDADLRALLTDELRERGATVVPCASAEAAWTVYQGKTFPLVVLDVGLPGMDGLTFCRRLRTLPGGERSVVLILTGRSAPDTLTAVLDAGANDYLPKPFDLSLLHLRLAILERQAAQIAARTAAEEALRRSEARFRSLVQHAGDLILVLDAGAAIRYASPAARRLLGHEPEELTNRPDAVLIHPDDQDRARAIGADSRAHPGEQTLLELRLRHRDGSYRQMEGSLTNLLDDPSVAGLVANLRDVSERRAFEEQLAHQALHDPLTRLPNRALFVDRLRHALDGAARRGEPVTILILDLDRFKLVTESRGHAAGDRLLAAVGLRLQGRLRPGDTVARLGGDEFGILLDGPATARDGLALATAILADLRAPIALEEDETFLTASVGIAGGAPGSTSGEVLKGADIALYRAKAAGRNTAMVYEPGQTRAVPRLDLEADLRRALARDELRLFYQPEVDLATGGVVGWEALVRWQHPTRGLVSPGEFIPAAEESGLIVPIGRWVLGEACRRMRALRAPPDGAGSRDLGPFINVNLSARELLQPDFVGGVRQTLAETGLAPGALKLEITERKLVEDVAAVTGALSALRTLGVRLAIDDFGTGYSSLAYLRRLTVDTIKIDRSFVGGLGRDEDSLAIVRAVASLAHALGMDVTAEGIETAEQLVAVRDAACDRGQGYLFGRPRPDDGEPRAAS